MIVEKTARRGSRSVWFVAAVAALGLVAGCAQSNTPTGYDEVTRKNFIEGCMGEGTDLPGASEQTCVCAYDWISQNVPFDSQTRASVGDYAGPDFVDLDKTLRDSPEEFPEEITKAISEECPGWGGSASNETDSTGSVGPVAPEKADTSDTTDAGQSVDSDASGASDTTV